MLFLAIEIIVLMLKWPNLPCHSVRTSDGRTDASTIFGFNSILYDCTLLYRKFFSIGIEGLLLDRYVVRVRLALVMNLTTLPTLCILKPCCSVSC